MDISLEEAIFLASLALLVVVILCGVVAMCLAKSKRMSAAALEDIEGKMANYEESCELVHGEFAEYLEDAIRSLQQQATAMLPRRVLMSDAATDTDVKTATHDGSSQTDATPPATVRAIEVPSVSTAGTDTDGTTSLAPAADRDTVPPPKPVSLPAVIEVKPAARTQGTIRFIGSHPVI